MQNLPRRVVVSDVVRSRYASGVRPTSWDERKPGVEIIRTDAGEEIQLYSSGGQSTPAAGWELLLMSEAGGSSSQGVTWTLYGIRPQH